ncbi:hypothetical protein A0J61_02620 [Choanephora cucurbitarum]|uniref:Uncharacterized protein n=1 Tax=Choanephora cucurbitarum TaxID=101091 RepID=A0A1C7NK08_9FUNG|nr:hypothetical protein A0J61_02620 [Choanephora cucurbitarum]
MGRSYSDKVCCCIPSRVGVLLVCCIIFSIYLTLTILMFLYEEDLQLWSTAEDEVDNPLTIEAFNGIFTAFAVIFISYSAVSALGILVVFMRRKKWVRVYHVINWFYVLLLFTITVSIWAHFNMDRNNFINTCQIDYNIANNITNHPYYTPLVVPGKQVVAGGSDKSACIDLVRRMLIGSGILVFSCNLIQVYWARTIGKYAIHFKKSFQHKRLETRDEDMMSIHDH